MLWPLHIHLNIYLYPFKYVIKWNVYFVSFKQMAYILQIANIIPVEQLDTEPVLLHEVECMVGGHEEGEACRALW